MCRYADNLLKLENYKKSRNHNRAVGVWLGAVTRSLMNIYTQLTVIDIIYNTCGYSHHCTVSIHNIYPAIHLQLQGIELNMCPAESGV